MIIKIIKVVTIVKGGLIVVKYFVKYDKSRWWNYLENIVSKVWLFNIWNENRNIALQNATQNKDEFPFFPFYWILWNTIWKYENLWKRIFYSSFKMENSFNCFLFSVNKDLSFCYNVVEP